MIPSGEAEAGRPNVDAGPPSGDLFTFPVSIAQRRFWVLDQLEPGNPAYNIAVRFRLRGPLDYSLVERAFNEIIRRHEVLRTTFDLENGEPVQLIHPALTIKVSIVDLRHFPETERAAEAERLAVIEARARFYLGVPPLFRVGLLRLADEEHMLLITVHHIVADGWSIGVITNELGAICDAFARGRECPLPELPIQYADFTLWQKERMEKNPLEREAAYWREQLRDLPDSGIPTDNPRPAIQTHDGHIVSILLPQSLTDALRDISNRQGATLFMTMLAAFKVLLHRHTGQTDIVVGSPIAGRNRVELEPLIGAFINTLVLRTDLSGDPEFLELLKRANITVTQAFAHQDLPFEHLVDLVRAKRDVSRNPLFQVNFIYQRDFIKPLHFSGITLTAVPSKSPGAILDLNFFLVERAEGWRFSCEFNTILYSEATARRMLGHFRSLLESIAANPAARLSRLTLLSPAERHQLLVEWNGTEVAYPRDRCLHELIEEQVARAPDAVAVVFGDKQLTYRQLNERAGQLANHLKTLGVGPDALVGICVERSLEMVVGLLGILKAGGAYVPLDPEYPADRLAFMVADAGVSVLLTQEHLVASLPAHQARVIRLDADWSGIASAGVSTVVRPVRAENLAYMIYTSGSTGRPKGAMNTHVAIVNRLLWMQDAYRLTPADRVLQKTPFSFDVSVWEFFWPLLTGAALVVARPGGHKDPAYLSNLINRERITTLHFVPSMLSAFLDQGGLEISCASVKRVVCSGEALPYELQQRFFSALPAELHNLYGPTEAAVDVTYWPCERNSSLRFVPIGRPIANTQIYLLDRHLEPVPIGVPGELHIGGIGLARGYHNRPELTAEKFIPDPFRPEPGARLYKTGDLARFMPDGAIEYLGRLDDQVKIRGFRIELGEIESVLAGLPGVREAAVVVRGDGPGDQRLVAYLTTTNGEPLKVPELRALLQARLPEYMVPSAFKQMDKFPLSPSGKLDRKALPAPDQTPADAGGTYTPPSSPIEELLAVVWAGLLHLPRVGIHDNFFELGGNSLLTMQVIDRINNAGLHLTPTQFFQHQTIAELAAVAGTKQAVPGREAEWSSLVALQPNGSRPPFYLVHTLPGDVLGYMELVRSLGRDQPCYGFQANGLGRKEDSHRTFEEMAAHYVRLMRDFQPRGPYYLGGWCFGGNIAAEMALQLAAQGQQVALLALIETWAYPPGLRHFEFYLNQFRCFLQLGPKSMVREAFGRLARTLKPGPPVADPEEFAFSSVQSGPFKNREFIYEINTAATKKYRSRPYTGKVTLFDADYRREHYKMPWSARWNTLAGETEVFIIPGEHRSLIKDPGVRILAEKLKICLTNAQSASKTSR